MPAIHNALIGAPQIARALRQAFGGDFELNAAERLGETLTPIVDLWRRPEWALLRGEFLATGGMSLAAPGAGLIAQIQLFNPVTSRRILVARPEVSSSGTNTFELRHHTAVLSALSAGIWKRMRDFRAEPTSPLGEIWFDNTAAAATGTRIYSVPSLGNTPYRWDHVYILAPGTGLSVVTGAQNQQLTANFEWYEREVYPGELD